MPLPKAYTGDKPYIFISYPHRDSKRVLPIIERLNRQGFRCWYDEGIDPGTEWDENIAGHLRGCSYVIAFISEAYLASDNCKDELNYARDLGKPRLLVYLENVELPQGMAMRLNRLQAIHWYTYPDSEAAFRKLFSAKEIDICREGSESAKAEAHLVPPNDKLPEVLIPPRKPGFSLAAGVAAAAAALALGLLVFFLWPKNPPESPTEPAQTQATEVVSTETTAPEVSQAAMVSVTLDAPASMSAGQFRQAEEILRSRLELLTGGGSFGFEAEGDSYLLQIPEDAFGGVSAKDVLYHYICRPCEAAFYDAGNRFRDDLRLRLEPGHILSVEKCRGSVHGLYADASEYDYLKVTLTDAYADQLRSASSSWETLGLAFNLDDYPSLAVTILPEEDLTGFVLYDPNWERLAAADLLAFNLTHELLPGSFEPKVQILSHWEPLNEKGYHGALQVDADALPEDAVTLYYLPASQKEPTQGDMAKTGDMLKDRLDVLGSPYAFGTGQAENSIVIRIPPDRLSTAAAEYLCSGIGAALALDSGMYRMSLPSALEQRDEALALWISEDAYEMDQIMPWLEERTQEGLTTHITWNEFHLPMVTAKSEQNGISIHFPQELSWLPQYLQTLQATKLPVLLELEQSEASGETIAWGLNYDAQLAAIQTELRQLDPGITCACTKEELWVYLHLPVDSAFCQNGLSLTRQAYEIADLENSVFEQMTVVLTDEENGTLERARFCFKKSYAFLSGGARRTMEVSGLLANGRCSFYQEEFDGLVHSDPFFSEISDEEPKWYYHYYSDGDSFSMS